MLIKPLNCYCSKTLSINNLKCLCLLTLNGNSKQFIRRKHQTSLKKSYETLGLKESCEDEDLRLAFVHLAKQYHPDSGSPSANSNKFSEIERAYRLIQRERNSRKDDTNSLPDVEEFDIKHTAPQHRNYLAYDTGVGTPSERQRRHTVERAQKAVDNITEHRLKKIKACEKNTLVGMEKHRAGDFKTRFGIDRLVEDLIQESINRGEFRDLPGMGKPLKDRATAQNPYVDFVTHKLNEILIDNGFVPEWIQLSKEIREETKELESKLTTIRNELGSLPLSLEKDKLWKNTLKNYQEIVNNINKKINKFNLLVPILQKQMLLINLNNIAKKILDKPSCLSEGKKSEDNMIIQNNSVPTNLMDLLFSAFDRKKK